MPRSSRAGLVLVVLAAFFASACSSRPGNSGTNPGTGNDPNNPQLIPMGDADGGTNNPPPQNGDSCNKMDILFVIDNSGSMMEEQQNVGANFPKFIEVLNDFRTNTNKALDYRIAVTTTAVDITGTIFVPLLGTQSMKYDGDNGAFRGGCDLTGNYLTSADSMLLQTFACVAKVGTMGSPLEMPLKALKEAVSDRVADGTNKDFFRDDALLAVVILTDEDDCSLQESTVALDDGDCPAAGTKVTAQEVIAAVDQFKGDRSKWAVAVIAGPPGDDVCESSFGMAFPGNRLKDFTDAVGKNAVFSSICDGDLSGSLMDAVDAFNIACNDIVLY